MIVWDLHAKLFHAGTSRVLRQLLDEFWVIKARVLVKRVLKDCSRCRRYNASAFKSPEAYLASFRNETSAPFAHCGVDHFGPLYLKSRQKMYGLLSVCANVRAVHI